MAGRHLLHPRGGRFTIAFSAALLLGLGRASAENSIAYFDASAGSNDIVMNTVTGPGPGAGCYDSCGCPDICGCNGACTCCPDGLGFCETAIESVFGHPDPCCWCPLPLCTLFSEGWRQPWVPSPNGSGGAPRQGWINAADGNMYRLNFLTFAQAFKSGGQDDAYLAAYTLYTPLSRRLLLITNVPFNMYNSVGSGQPTIEPDEPTATTTQNQTTFGDVSFTPRILLHETQDLSITFDVTVLTPTGGRPLAGKTALVPTVGFWYNLAGGWVVRGGIGDFIPTDGSPGEALISQLAIGQTITDHDALFGDFTYYVSAVANSPLENGGGATSVTLTPGMRTHLGYDFYFLAGMPVPVTERRVGDLGMIFWFMKAW